MSALESEDIMSAKPPEPISEPLIVTKLLASIRSSLSFMIAISHLKPVSILLATIRSSLSFMTAISHLKPEDREPEDRENIVISHLKPEDREPEDSEIINTKYEFLKIKSANRQHCGSGNTFYNIFQARQNDTTQDFETLVYKNFVTGDITLNFCRLKRD
ncbi:hypothetical protein COLO4_19473 [Corchorus olitorius]|uniref:Uncharacterized protein n=1 Tax=Corchorus olitorius TaxID=93759 RepID=A0A1R3J576_9ROSI|nr:hypothetical protein COLO4_19473 [Corchorus olitorius]